MMETIEIVVCTDHKYVMPTGVMMHSVCKNNSEQNVRFHLIVDESVSEDDKADLRNVAEGKIVCFYAADNDVFSSMPLIGNITKATYYRLLIPQLLPDDIQKVLFLDGDIIVRHSILPLWETDLEGFAIAAVTDADESLIEKYNRQKYSPSLGHFNAGVMLMNLNYWRANNIQGEIKSYIKNHFESIRHCDQDILNYVLRDKKVTLAIKYNTQTQFLYVLEKACYDYWKYEKEVLEAREDPVILHYTLGKPWVVGSIHPYNTSFVKYQNETKWKGQFWERRKRPFWVKVLSHSYDAIESVFVKMGLIRKTILPPKTDLFMNLPPIDCVD